MLNTNGYCFDIEANGFYFQADKVWTIWFKDLNDPSKFLKINPFKDSFAREKIIEWNNQYDTPIITGHFILGYDCFMLLKHFDLEFTVGKDSFCGKPCVFIDTLFMSQYTNPDLVGHGLGSYGDRFGYEKIDYHEVAKQNGTIPKDAKKGDEFLIYHPDMDIYCERDVDLNIKVFHKLWNDFESIYNCDYLNIPNHYRCGQKQHYLMSCQEFTGWRFDQKLGADLQDKISKMMLEIEEEVLPQLPPRKLKKGEIKDFTMPAKPFKKDGSLSNVMIKFIEKHNGIEIRPKVFSFYGKEYEILAGCTLDVTIPMEIKDGDDLKEWFIEQGWEPTLFNFKRGEDGKPIRDEKTKELIKTSPKMQEAGKLCPNLEALEGDIPRQVVRYLSLRNRQSVLTSWMNDPRLQMDGRLSPSRTGITPTMRIKHSKVVNVPKASDKVLLGKEFRSLFIAEEGMLIAAGDASALEGRVQGHYTYQYDGGATADEILNGDPHSKNAKAFYSEETKGFDIKSPDFDKDSSGFKQYRDRSKNGYYGLLYGCAPKKLAAILGKPENLADKLYAAFWEANPATSKLKDAVTRFWETKGQKKWLPAIDGRRIVTRKKSALLNSIFQSCGAIAMDYASCYMDSWLGGIKFDKDFKPTYYYKGYVVRRIGFFHDELEFECDEAIALEISKMIEKAIQKAGEHLKMKVALAGEGKVGLNWKEVH